MQLWHRPRKMCTGFARINGGCACGAQVCATCAICLNEALADTDDTVGPCQEDIPEFATLRVCFQRPERFDGFRWPSKGEDFRHDESAESGDESGMHGMLAACLCMVLVPTIKYNPHHKINAKSRRCWRCKTPEMGDGSQGLRDVELQRFSDAP